MADRDDITLELCRQLLEYNSATGIFYWKIRPLEFFKDGAQSQYHNWRAWNAKMAGKEAFAYINPDGYKQGAIFDKKAIPHRLAWLMHYGEWPSGIIDHIDGNCANNRIANLRDVSVMDNGRNLSVRPNSKSGHIGVTWDKKRGAWRARIFDGQKDIFLGRYASVEDAARARKIASEKYGYHENHGHSRITPRIRVK